MSALRRILSTSYEEADALERGPHEMHRRQSRPVAPKIRWCNTTRSDTGLNWRSCWSEDCSIPCSSRIFSASSMFTAPTRKRLSALLLSSPSTIHSC